MGNQSVWGERDGQSVRVTVFRLNGKVGIALGEKPVFLSMQDAFSVADQMMEQADEILAGQRGSAVGTAFGIQPLGAELEASLREAGKNCLDIGF